MKSLIAYSILILSFFAFPVFASADVAGVGVFIALGALAYILIAAVIILAVAILIKLIRGKRKP